DETQKTRPRQRAYTSTRVRMRLNEEATRPAAKASESEPELTKPETAASAALTPPNRNGTVSTGSTASQRVSARNPWAKLLATTISPGFSHVRHSKPKSEEHTSE